MNTKIMRNPLNFGDTIGEELMNFFNEEKYAAWKRKKYGAAVNVAENFCEITNKNKIVIIGDYDVDGVMGTRLMYNLLHQIHPQATISYISPRRFTDGYGISEHITNAILSEFDPSETCIVTVDNGISQFKALDALYDKGYTIALTDHHEPQVNEDDSPKLPKHDCLINPHVKNEEHANDFNFEHYCGAGVVYQLAKVLIDDEDVLKKEFLPYAAIATIADVVPLIEDNWKLVKEFLDDAEHLLPEHLNFTDKPAKYVDEEDIKFTIAPVLNAAGRLLDNGADKVLRYLFNPTQEGKRELMALNEERKTLVKEQTNLVMTKIEELGLQKTEPICVSVPGLHHGIVGIIAGKVTEKYNRACFVASDGKGSGRAPDTFDIFQFGVSHLDLFDKFGGHPCACGFSISDENLEKLRAFAKETTVYVAPKHDVDVSLNDIAAVYTKSKPCRPFGTGNPAPICRVRITPKDKCEYIGKPTIVRNERGEEVETKLHLSRRNADGSKVIHFYHRDSETGKAPLKNENDFYGHGTVNLSYFRGEVTPQLNIEKVYDPEEEPLTLKNRL